MRMPEEDASWRSLEVEKLDVVIVKPTANTIVGVQCELDPAGLGPSPSPPLPFLLSTPPDLHPERI